MNRFYISRILLRSVKGRAWSESGSPDLSLVCAPTLPLPHFPSFLVTLPCFHVPNCLSRLAPFRVPCRLRGALHIGGSHIFTAERAPGINDRLENPTPLTSLQETVATYFRVMMYSIQD